MSFLKIEDHNKRDETVKESLDLKNKIKDNFRKERLGEIETQRDLAKLFKPVTETQIATTKELQEGLKPIKEGIEKLPQAITFPAYPSIDLPKEDVLELGPNAASALQRFLTKTGVDKTYGIYDKGGKFFIGTKEVKIKGDDIIIDNSMYRGTPGLWELIVSRDPNRDLYTPIDFENYKRILIETDAMRSPKNPNKPKSNKGAKWALLRDNVWKGLKKEKGVIVIPSDPNALLERLDLLFAKKRVIQVLEMN